MYEQIDKNIRRTVLLFIGFIAVLAAVGYVFAETTPLGGWAIPLAVVLACVSVVVSYYFSDCIVLSVSQAVPADPLIDKHLINTVEGLSLAAGFSVPPRVYVINDTAPNAFATGRDPKHSIIVVTRGLVTKLNRLELEAVVAHEMAHIRNYDMLFSTLAVVMVGIITLLADWWWRMGFRGHLRMRNVQAGLLLAVLGLILMLLAPVSAQLLQLALSRRREYLADVSGAMLTRYPAALADALEKIMKDTDKLKTANKATAALYIVNPLLDHGGKVNALFETHPPTVDRIRILRAMAHDMESNRAANQIDIP